MRSVSHRRWLAALGLVCATAMAEAPDKERREPPPPATLEAAGLRYQALHWGKARGLGQNGGLVEAIEMSSGRSLWVRKVYQLNYRDDIEGDKQDLFISELQLCRDPAWLLVLDERGGRHGLHLPSGRAAAPPADCLPAPKTHGKN